MPPHMKQELFQSAYAAQLQQGGSSFNPSQQLEPWRQAMHSLQSFQNLQQQSLVPIGNLPTSPPKRTKHSARPNPTETDAGFLAQNDKDAMSLDLDGLFKRQKPAKKPTKKRKRY